MDWWSKIYLGVISAPIEKTFKHEVHKGIPKGLIEYLELRRE
jgi:hypothetical protein